jgi:hypothetical protein
MTKNSEVKTFIHRIKSCAVRAAFPLWLGAACLAMSQTAGTAAPTNVWVDATYSASTANDGHTWLVDAFATLQAAIDGVATGGTINVNAGTYKGAKATKAVNINAGPGTIIQGASPALTISFPVSITGGTWQPAPASGNNPAILILAGGSLTLRGATVLESTGADQSCVEVAGGTFDGGTTGNPGGNTFVITGPGRFVTNNTPVAIQAIGNVWKQDSTTYSTGSLADNFSIEDRMAHALDDSAEGLITWVANNNVYVTAASGSIQRGIDAATAGWVVNVAAGNFSENLTINKANLEIAGASQANTFVVPAVSAPIGSGDDCDVYGGGAGSIMMLVRASAVTIHDLTLDGNNPSLTSGITRGGVDIDARAGILTDFNTGAFNQLNVHDVTVKNIYLRGIENHTGTGISLVNNTVQNVWGSTDCSIGIFNRSGSGLIAYNNVSGTPDAISANNSSGTQFLTNTVTLSASGIHSDNNGSAGGLADSISGNTVLDSAPDGSGNSYGLWLLNPYRAVVVEGNVVSNVLNGIVIFGQGSAVTPMISGNSVLGNQTPGGVGIYVTTWLFGLGTNNVAAALNNNFISNHVTGIVLEQGIGFTASLSALGNSIVANAAGVYANGGKALLQNNVIVGNTQAGLRVANGAIMDAGQCGAGSNVTGLGVSSGGNDLTGYGFDNLAPWAVENLNTSAQPGVLAFNNNYGTQANVKDVVYDAVDNAGNSAVGYSQAGALLLSCPGPVSVQCLAGVPASASTLAGFLSLGGVVSTTDASVVPGDGLLTPGPQEGTITRTYTVTDGCGNSQSCNQVITVDDTAPPVVVCKPVTVQLDASGHASITPTDVFDSTASSDNCSGPINLVSVVPSTFTCANYGANLVTLTADDGRGNTNTCQATVTVSDLVPPSLACSPITIPLDSTGNYSLSGSDIASLVASASDACGLAATNVSQTTFSFCDLPSKNVTVTVTDIHGNSSTCVATVNITAPPTPSVVYVDGNYPGTCAGVSFPSNGIAGPYYVGFNAFKTIQAAVAGVASGGTVNVAAGTYAEQLTLSKQLSLVGPNSGKTGYDLTRAAEALIVPGSVLNTSSPREWDDTPLISITADGVILDGFTISGDNPAINGYAYAGMNVEAGRGIRSVANNVVFKNNVVEKFTYIGFHSEGGQVSPHYTGLELTRNLFDSVQDLNQLGFGYAMDIQGTAAVVADNKVTNTRAAMEIQPYRVVGSPTVVSNNDVSVWRLGIYYNYTELGASAWTISANQIAACLPPSPPTGPVVWEGVRAETMFSSANGGTISSNVVDGSVALGDPTHVWGGFSHAVWGLRYKGGASDSTQVFFNGNTVHDVEFGFVHDAPANIVLTGNSLTATESDIQVQQDYSSAGAPLGTGGTGNIDATAGNSYDGVDSAAASLTQLFAIEDKIKHALDTASLGLVRVRSGQLYVTTSSGSIQRGIDAATVGDVVNVSAGTFTENVSLNKAVSLLGAGSGVGGTVIATASGDPSTGLIQISASGTSGNPITLQDLQVTPSGRSGLSVGRFTQSTGVAVDYLTLNNVRVIGDNVNPCSEQERGLYVDNTSSLQHLIVNNSAFDNLHYGWYLQKSVSADASTVKFVQVTGTSFSHNNIKGVYAEKLSDTTFSCCQVSQNGYDGSLLSSCGFAANMAGFDINLKAGSYANLVFQNSDFIQNARGGAANGFALGLKGRGTGNDPSYVSFPGLVNGVTVSGCRFDGNERGVRFGEAGKDNTTPTAVVVQNNSFTADATGLGLIDDLAAAAPNMAAINNWWGSITGPTRPANAGGTGDAIAGAGQITFSPWLGDATDTIASCGFQPNPTPIYYSAHHLNFLTQPGNAALSSPLAPQPVVQVIDENGGVAVQFNGSIALAIGNNPGGGTLGGTTILPAINGVATFTDVAVNTGGGAGYTLAAATTVPVIPANSSSFDISNPAPTISSLNPFWRRAGSGAFSLTVTGNNFVPNSVVYWNGQTRPTHYVSATGVTADILASDIANVGTAQVKVSNPTPSGGETAELTFRIEIASPPIVYVDDDYSSQGPDALVSWPYSGSGTHIIGYDAFATVQGGINGVTNTGTVNVAAGNYAEQVSANKSVVLSGANAGIAGCGARGAESVINGGSGIALDVTANGVTVDGFALTGAVGLRDLGHIGVSVRDNAITVAAAGLDVEGIAPSVSAGVTVANNCVTLTSQFAGSNPTIGLTLLAVTGEAPVLTNNEISGAFYGGLLYNLNASTPVSIAGGSVHGIMQGVAVVNAFPPTAPVYKPTSFRLDSVSMYGFSGNYPAPALSAINLHAGVYVFSGGADNTAIINGSITNVTITGTGNISPDSSGIDLADFSSGAGVRQQIAIQNSSINTNRNRGLSASGANVAVGVTQSSLLGNGFDPYVTGGNPGFGVVARNNAQVSLSQSYVANPVLADQVGSTVYALECDANTPALGPTLVANDCSISDNGNG